MSNRATWAHELAIRCRAIGWQVAEPNGRQSAYQVTCPPCQMAGCPHVYALHLTTSDRAAEVIAVTFLKRHGLVRRETALARSKKAVAAQKNKEEREAAERQAEEMARKAQAAVVNRAAGPYAGPEYVEDSWFTDDHPSMITRLVIMTPRQAEWLLGKLNSSNRKFNPDTRDKYRNVILSGQWQLTHQGMAIDWDKVLQDGQHRLAAIVKADVEVPAQFSCGVDPKNFKVIDEGLQRTGAQLIGKDGEANVRVMAALVKLIWVFDSDDRSAVRNKLTNQQVYDGFAGNRDRIKVATLAGYRHYRNATMKSTSPNTSALAAAWYLLTRANGDGNPYVEAFFNGLARERKLDRTHALDERDPRIKLRAYFGNARAQRKNLRTFDQVCLIILAWNNTIEGRRRDNLRWHTGQAIPRIVTIGADSGCPELLQGEV